MSFLFGGCYIIAENWKLIRIVLSFLFSGCYIIAENWKLISPLNFPSEMEEEIKVTLPGTSFDYELYEGDPDHLRTVVATPKKPDAYIDPASLKFKYRIGHGSFGDVWLATHHQSADDFDEYHEVAVKMLHPIKEDFIGKFLSKFEDFWIKLQSRQAKGVCWLHGVSVISGKVGIVVKYYEGSVGDLLARVKGGRLPLLDVLWYGVKLIQGIQELHSMGFLVLNLKPPNFLLNDQEQVIIGDFGIPGLLLSIPYADPDICFRLGTPNYMAPEQWEPEVRGPIADETDSWGFACSIVEMLTGVHPWFGKSPMEIYQSVVVNHEKPVLPNGLPPEIEDILHGCFEYDLRNRPLMPDILKAFERSASTNVEWIDLESTLLGVKSTNSSRTSWSLLKDHLQVGDTVRSRCAVNSCTPQKLIVTEGIVVGLEKDTDQDGHVLVRVRGLQRPLRLSVSALERVTSGFAAGDWVRLVKETNEHEHSQVGILHSIQRDGTVAVGFLGLETLWKGHSSELRTSEPFFVGYFVRLKKNVKTPRFKWPQKRGGSWATGRISEILSNGCLVVRFPGMLLNRADYFLADPAEVEHISFDTCTGLVEKYQHMEDFHWAVRPLASSLALFAAGKLGIFVGKNVGGKLMTRCRRNREQKDARGGSSPPRRRRSIANILFKESSAPTATAR